jgi:hypothetical protein
MTKICKSLQILLGVFLKKLVLNKGSSEKG